MQPSMFNVRVPLPERGNVFLMNTFSDAQLLVSEDVVSLLDSLEADRAVPREYTADERSALESLTEQGFIVKNRAAERDTLDQFFQDFREDTGQLRITVLTTLQCNFACDYCIQGDHGDYNKHAHKMSMENAARVADWAEAQLDALKPSSFVITFFGGEPLLNLPVLFYLAERLQASTAARGIRQLINVITNGLLLTPAIVQRLNPCGLNGVKITLDGDQQTHDRMRPLRGGQGTFDKIIRNLREVAGLTRIAIGGNFDADSVDSYPALLDFLREQEFASSITKVAFKPVIKMPKPAEPARPSNVIALTLVSDEKPLGGSCMSAAGSSAGSQTSSPGSSICDSCHFVDEKMTFLREETRRRGFPTIDGVHMGPCEIHRRHAHTIGPDGDLYACPGFAGDASQSVGHITQPVQAAQAAAAARFDAISGWRKCGDCSFIPVCAGGCSVAAHSELGDMNTPSCHKRSFEDALISMAHEAACCA
jgi:uncharacterized protein